MLAVPAPTYHCPACQAAMNRLQASGYHCPSCLGVLVVHDNGTATFIPYEGKRQTLPMTALRPTASDS